VDRRPQGEQLIAAMIFADLPVLAGATVGPDLVQTGPRGSCAATRQGWAGLQQTPGCAQRRRAGRRPRRLRECWVTRPLPGVERRSG
jgi:hypothetical protein